jgi:hypothetical protein
MPAESSRTFHLDEELVRGLGESISEKRMGEFLDLMEELPEALTTEEILDIGIQMRGQVGGSTNYRNELERDFIFNLGVTSVLAWGDFVTASNAEKLLRRRGVTGIIGSFLLGVEIRRTKKAIIEDLRALTEESMDT